jgi:hypothetical protein
MNTTPRVTSCPDIGDWRAWIDREVDGVESPTLAAHLETCPGCKQVVDELRADGAYARDSLATLAPQQAPTSAEVAMARERLEWRLATKNRHIPNSPAGGRKQEPAPTFIRRLSTPLRIAAGAVAAALVLAAVVAFTPQGSLAASQFLAQFRSQSVSAVDITPESQADLMRSMKALSNLGTLEEPAAAGATTPASAARIELQQARTASFAEAASALKFDLLTPDPATLPAGMSKAPSVRLSPAQQVRFTFDTNKARTYYQSQGHPDVNLPDKFNGATLSVSLPAAAMLDYTSGSSSKADLVLVEAGELVVDVQGNTSLPEMRDFLLSLPGLPPAVVSQLKGMDKWNNTLPIPVPVDQVHADKVNINGNEGLLLNDNSGAGSAAVWHANGHLMAAAGTLKADDLTRIVKSLAVR